MIDTETAKNLVTGSIWRWRATPTLEELEEVEVRGMSGRNHGHVSYVYKGCSDLFYMEILRFLERACLVSLPGQQGRPTCNAGCTPQTPCLSVECPARAENKISKSAWATRQHPNLIPASWLGSIMSDYIVPGGEPSARPEFTTSGVTGGLACDMGLRR